LARINFVDAGRQALAGTDGLGPRPANKFNFPLRRVHALLATFK
jgi:hypothetical protein